jgi:putative protein-disulfide isomerase
MDSSGDREIIYVGDPMCSWCWGIAPELQALQGRHLDLPFRVIVGGLRPGPPYAEPMDDRMAEFLRHHWEEVNARSCQPFDYAILERRDWVYDTEPACRAVVAMRGLDEAKAWPLFKRLQRAFYAEGILLNDPEVYPQLVEEIGAEPSVFMEAFVSEDVAQATWQDFVTASRWGIRGFPAVIARDGVRGHIIANGYTRADDMERALMEALPTVA